MNLKKIFTKKNSENQKPVEKKTRKKQAPVPETYGAVPTELTQFDIVYDSIYKLKNKSINKKQYSQLLAELRKKIKL